MAKIEEINNMKELLSKSLVLLNKNDKDLIELQEDIVEYSSELEKFERKLHEVCINHRLACYIELLLPQYFTGDYKVDIEYNRYYKNKKHLTIDNEIAIVRPDIIVHTRAKQLSLPQHLLIIEAKKNITSTDDAKVVKSFIQDNHYQYVFGATIRYNDFVHPQITLYYKDCNNTLQFVTL
ncbi:MAG: hypothetical protein RR925_01445 [Erysipelotrichaceae bacterium]